jgi:uncharacterized protein (TIGR02996 family)
MSDDVALRQAILDNPADDVPRLAYADWCEENGDEERAEFIRVQIELSRLSWWDDAWDGLVQRERELWERHGEAWRRPLPPWARKKIAFRRGFASGRACSLRQWLTQSGKLRRQAPVDTLEITCPNEGDALQFPDLAVSPLLAGVSALAAYWLEQKDLSHLVSSPHVGGLRILSLHRNFVSSGPNPSKVGEMLAGASSLAGLTALSLGAREIRTDGATALAESPHLARLTALDLNRNRIGDAGVRALANSRHLGNLTHLDLCQTSCRLKGVEALAASTRLINLVYLNLHGDWFGDKLGPPAAEVLAGASNLANLEILGLHQQEIGPDGMRALAGSPHLANLKALYLFDNHITDDGLRALAESPYLTQLRALDLAYNRISDAGLRALTASPNITHLRFLRLEGGCTQSAIKQLKAAQRRLGGWEVEITALTPLTGCVHRDMEARLVTLNADIDR